MKTLNWIDHAGFVVKTKGKTIYIDPFRLQKFEHADIILITHPHSDHLSMADISRIADGSTDIFVPKDSVEKLTVGRVTGVEPNKSYNISEIKFSTIPAYNLVKERLHFHPKENKWVGYILNVAAELLYHAGDTDFIDEMKKVDVNLALLPMGGTYVMDTKEMIEASKNIKAKNVAPMHYRALLGKEGSKKAEELFKKEVKNGIILEQIQEPRYSF